MGGNIPGGSFLAENFPEDKLSGGSLIGGNLPDWNFAGGSFPDTEKNISEEFSSVHALKLIFIRKVFILQTHNLRV